MLGVIIKLSDQVPQCCPELKTLGRTLVRRAEDILAYFTHPHASNGPTEAINGRLEHLRGTALGLPNLTHYIIKSLLDCGGFRPSYTLNYEEPSILDLSQWEISNFVSYLSRESL